MTSTTRNDIGSPYRVPPEPRRWPSIALATAVHLGLLAFLFIGIDWQNHEPVAVEAEVWDMKTQDAAPTPPPPQEVLAPEAPVEPPPPPPKVVETPPPPVAEPPPPKAPDIALEREKKKAEQKKLLAEQKLEDEREAKLAQKKADALAEKKEQAEKKAQALADKKLEEKKLEEKRLAAEKLEEKKLEEKKLAEKIKGEKLAKAKAEAAEQSKLDKLRDAEMKRMLAGAGGSGEAAKSSAPKSDPGYLAGIRTKVKSTTSYTGNTDVAGNPTAEFKIEQLPTGEIMNVKLLKSSGVGSFDDAVEKGIIKASPLPKKKDGTVERTLVIAFKMKDLN